MSITTGAKRLNHLLNGGIPYRSRSLLYGPSFQGKEVLAKQTLIHAIQAGHPTVVVLTNETALDYLSTLRAMDEDVDAAVADGTLLFVDTYANSIGVDEPHDAVEYVESALDLNGITIALHKQQARILDTHDEHLLVFDSVSTLVLYSNAQSTFRFLQILIGKARQIGATSLILMDAGMHSDPEVQMFRHLCDGEITIDTDKQQTRIKVTGLGVKKRTDWLDATFNDTKFDVVGSLSAGRIQ